jgi:hypothetical protein
MSSQSDPPAPPSPEQFAAALQDTFTRFGKAMEDMAGLNGALLQTLRSMDVRLSVIEKKLGITSE